jgi:hypothetical protein
MLDSYVDRLLEMSARRRMHGKLPTSWGPSRWMGTSAPLRGYQRGRGLVGRLRESGEEFVEGDDAGPVVNDYMRMVHAIQTGREEAAPYLHRPLSPR